MDCREITNRIGEISSRTSELARAFDEENIDFLASEMPRIDQSASEILLQIDPFRVRERVKIAKKNGFKYVGKFENGCAIAKRGGSGPSEYLVNEEGEVLRGPCEQILPFYKGRTIIIDQLRTFIYDLEQGVAKTYLNDKYVFLRDTWSDGVIAANVVANQPMAGNIMTGSVYINMDGEEIYQTELTSNLPRFNNGVLLRRKQDECIAYDQTGNEIKTLKKEDGYDQVKDFSEDIAICSRKTSIASVYEIELLKKDGTITKTKLKTYTTSIRGFDDGYALAQDPENGYYFFDKNGDFVRNIPGTFLGSDGKLVCMKRMVKGKEVLSAFTPDRDLGDFAGGNSAGWGEGYAGVTDNSVTHYFLGEDGKKIGNESGYLEINTFSEGLAEVKDNQGWMYIDESNRNPFLDKDQRFKYAGCFREGVAQVKDIDGNAYYVDSRGRRVFG